jgi:hypothetical protein
MPAVVRCRLCGKDHPYREDIERVDCEECGSPLSMDNTRMIIKPRDNKQADPLEGM